MVEKEEQEVEERERGGGRRASPLGGKSVHVVAQLLAPEHDHRRPLWREPVLVGIARDRGDAAHLSLGRPRVTWRDLA